MKPNGGWALTEMPAEVYRDGSCLWPGKNLGGLETERCGAALSMTNNGLWLARCYEKGRGRDRLTRFRPSLWPTCSKD